MLHRFQPRPTFFSRIALVAKGDHSNFSECLQLNQRLEIGGQRSEGSKTPSRAGPVRRMERTEWAIWKGPSRTGISDEGRSESARTANEFQIGNKVKQLRPGPTGHKF